MEFELLLLTTMLQLITGQEGQAVSLSVSPQRIQIGGREPSPQLTVNCSVAAPDITHVEEITVGRMYGGSDTQPLVVATNSSLQVQDTGLQSRLTTSGSFSGPTGTVELVLKELECSGVSAYYCKTQYEAGDVSRNDFVFVNVTVINNPPKQLTISKVPNRSLYYRDEIVRFTCTGRIGNHFDKNTENLLTWEWRSVGSVISPWVRYPNGSSIMNDPVKLVPASGGCVYTVGSSLTHTVSSSDINRQFRCSVQGEISISETLSTQDSASSAAVKVAMIRDINTLVLIVFFMYALKDKL
ncbi:uncharacterized protein LOC124272563 [Haliotis rubra]|uniref:uncharacterized protein LOC124272563 n=1 Tax=Haliotis rubra TaxID=36100 RepID=UPI001EE5DFE1|nr:uncharacterized protein LOC124272563 [Haliotis rubra]